MPCQGKVFFDRAGEEINCAHSLHLCALVVLVKWTICTSLYEDLLTSGGMGVHRHGPCIILEGDLDDLLAIPTGILSRVTGVSPVRDCSYSLHPTSGSTVRQRTTLLQTPRPG